MTSCCARSTQTTRVAAGVRINVDVSTQGRPPIYRQALVVLGGLEFLAVDGASRLPNWLLPLARFTLTS